MMKYSSLCLTLLLLSCGPAKDRLAPVSIAEGQHPVVAVCNQKSYSGANTPEFCSCLGREASYAANGDKKILMRMAQLAAADHETMDGHLSDLEKIAKKKRIKGKKGALDKSHHAWRVTLQNSKLRCSALSKKSAEPFFGFPY